MAKNLTATRVQASMDAKGWDQSELARRVDCSSAAINQLVLGHTQRSRLLPKIALELGVSLAYLMGESEDPEGEATELKLSSEEREWLDSFQRIDQRDRSALLQLARKLAATGDQ